MKRYIIDIIFIAVTNFVIISTLQRTTKVRQKWWMTRGWVVTGRLAAAAKDLKTEPDESNGDCGWIALSLCSFAAKMRGSIWHFLGQQSYSVAEGADDTWVVLGRSVAAMELMDGA